MGSCASKPKEIDFASCEAPANPKSRHNNNNITNKGVDVQAQPPLIDLSEPEKKSIDAEPEPKTKVKVEVAVVDDAEPSFAKPVKAETENKVIVEADADQNVKEIGAKVEGNIKESEKKFELPIDHKAAIDTEPAFARQAVEKKVETTKEIEKKVEVDIKPIESVKKVNDEPVFALLVKMPKANSTKENEKKVDDVVVPEIKAKETEKKDAFDTELIFSWPVKGKVESTKATEKKFEAKENEKKGIVDVERDYFLPVKTKLEASKETEKKVESVIIPKKAKENEKKTAIEDEPIFSWPIKTKFEATKESEQKVEATVIPSRAKKSEKKDKGVAENAKKNEKNVEKAEGVEGKAKATAKEMEKKVEAAVVGKLDKSNEVPKKTEKLDQK
ncbi:hypothetical protein Patl1_05540 [Pistacia atlantica]|uniref:Uncharacterized protein n=1 Tax=Pistacia atlantica TaxID=434234 RepID=A0ACC1BP32_9ROSI|nr:hypothetical protein Patl1_05540 [Pistacia atlantica]